MSATDEGDIRDVAGILYSGICFHELVIRTNGV